MLYFWGLLLIVLWAVTIWMGTRLAWSRGRSAWLGGLLAAVLPFVGLAIVWLLPPKQEIATLRQAAAQEHERVEQIEALEERDEQHRRSARG